MKPVLRIYARIKHANTQFHSAPLLTNTQLRMMKGIDPIIATVILVLLVVSIAAIVGPWIYDLATSTTGKQKNETDLFLLCQNTAYDFDTNYANNGVNWSDSANSLKVKIINTGSINLYDFSFEALINTTVIRYFNTTSSTQKAKANPLKPQQSAIIQAENTSIIVGGTLNEVRILNGVCLTVSIRQAL